MKRILFLAAVIAMVVAVSACTPLRPEQNDTPLPRQDNAIPPEEGGVTTGDTDNTGNTGNRGSTDDRGAKGNNGVSAKDDSTPEGLADGVYTGRTEKDERGHYGEIRITITNEKVAKAEYTEYTKDGKPKTQKNGFDYKQALEAFYMLPERLTITQNVDDIDDYAGATYTTEKFRTAAKNAISSGKNKARK